LPQNNRTLSGLSYPQENYSISSVGNNVKRSSYIKIQGLSSLSSKDPLLKEIRELVVNNMSI
jgi:hypothetical protein